MIAAAAVTVLWMVRGVRTPEPSPALTPAVTPAAAKALAARIDPALADVTATLGYAQATSAGTGMVLTSSGRVLTNNRVIEGATAVTVTDVGNHRTYRASMAGYDESRDVAVLQLAGASGLATVPLGSSSDVRVGEKVVALGNAGG